MIPMVIHSNAQPAASANAGAAIQARLHAKRKSAEGPTAPENDADLTVSPRASNQYPSTIPPIFDANGAEEATEFLRHHILTRPAASISVQANSRPQTVFELLDGIFE